MLHKLRPYYSLKRYLSSREGAIVFTYLIILCIISTVVFFYLYKDFVYATGGAFPYTKHGGGTTDGETPCAGGVNRGLGTDYGGNCSTAPGLYYNDPLGEAGQYASSECTHCHEPHASFGGSEAPPSTGNDAGPDTYLLMKEYGTNTVGSYAALCWYCHENMVNINGSGYGIGYGRWGFYQGQAVYQSSSHYAPPAGSFYWPEITGASIWPRKSRFGLPSGNLGSCLNCHTPHGIKAANAGSAYDTTSPDGTGGVPAAMQTVASGNPSVNADYLIPRQLIAWEEMLCENCHDASGPSTKNIQAEINKRWPSPSASARSGHPVDDTGLAGRHVVSEGLPVTDTTPPTGVYDPNKKHVECYDCHNPHADNSANRLEGMKYIDINGIVQDPATGARQPYVYEVCIKCHGDSHESFIPSRNATGSPEGAGGTIRTTSQHPEYGWCDASINPASTCTDGSNKRLEFDPSTAAKKDASAGTFFADNRAYHPVYQAGRNTSVVLTRQLAMGNLDYDRTIQCTDCHNNNITGVGSSDGTNFTPTYPGPVTQSNLTRATDVDNGYSFSDPVGPHGSTNVRILRANYNTYLGTSTTASFSSWDPTNFQLCFNCHDSRAFTDDDGLISSQRYTNFRLSSNQSGFSLCYWGSGPLKINLHALHLTNEPTSNAGWDILVNMYTTCANCHYNVHSNAEQTNTILEPGPDNNTHLINFSPQVQARNYAKPRWYVQGGGGGGEPCPGNSVCAALGLPCPCTLACSTLYMGIPGSVWCGTAACGSQSCSGSCVCPPPPSSASDMACNLTCHGGGMATSPDGGSTTTQVDAVYRGYPD